MPLSSTSAPGAVSTGIARHRGYTIMELVEEWTRKTEDRIGPEHDEDAAARVLRRCIATHERMSLMTQKDDDSSTEPGPAGTEPGPAARPTRAQRESDRVLWFRLKLATVVAVFVGVVFFVLALLAYGLRQAFISSGHR